MILLDVNKYDQKPLQWGPLSAVRAAIIRNCDRLGLPVPGGAFPIWEGSHIPWDAMTSEMGTLYGTAPYWDTLPAGKALNWGTANSGYFFSKCVKGMTYIAPDKWTIFACARGRSTTAQDILGGPANSANSYYHGLSLQYYPSSPRTYFTVDATQNATTSIQSGFNNKSTVQVMGVNYGSASRKVWQRTHVGLLTGTNTGSTSNRALANRFGLGLYADSTPTGTQPIITVLYFWPTDALGDAEFSILSEQPYCLLAPIPMPIIFDLAPASGTPISLTHDLYASIATSMAGSVDTRLSVSSSLLSIADSLIATSTALAGIHDAQAVVLSQVTGSHDTRTDIATQTTLVHDSRLTVAAALTTLCDTLLTVSEQVGYAVQHDTRLSIATARTLAHDLRSTVATQTVTTVDTQQVIATAVTAIADTLADISMQIGYVVQQDTRLVVSRQFSAAADTLLAIAAEICTTQDTRLIIGLIERAAGVVFRLAQEKRVFTLPTERRVFVLPREGKA